MRRNLSKAKRRRIRANLLHEKREAHRLARLHIQYNPNKTNSSTEPFRVSSSFRKTEPVRGKKILTFPTALNFDNQTVSTIETLRELQKELIYGSAGEIFIDQSSLEEITPEAAVVLVAELQRGLAYTSRRKNVNSNYPRSASAAKMLSDIGFYTALHAPTPKRKEELGSRLYFKIIADWRTDGRHINHLIQTFEKVISFDPIARKRLYGALTECMDNVRSHAYDEDPHQPDLLGEWWMAGFCDLSNSQVAFVFYDQGQGIPTTLKTKLSHRLRSLIHWNDTDLIRIAVEEGITREKSERHGSGLPSLKGFINELSPGGFLRVLSNSGDYTYFKNKDPILKSPGSPLNGSLIVWSIQAGDQNVNTISTENTAIDLRPKQEKLPL